MHKTRQNYDLVIDRLSFTRKYINCMHSTSQDRAQSIQLSDIHTVGVHHVCRDIECHVNYGRHFRLIWKVKETITEIFSYSISTNVSSY